MTIAGQKGNSARSSSGIYRDVLRVDSSYSVKGNATMNYMSCPYPHLDPCDLPSLSSVTSKTISSILGAWLDQYSEDFRKPPDYSCLKHLYAYIRQMFPGSDLQRRAQVLLGTFQRHKEAEPDQDGMAPLTQTPS
eukprot:g15614.t1